MTTAAEIVDIVLLVILAVTGIAVIKTRNLFVAVMLAGIYSLISAGLFVVMDAVDVAFTEAAVGAGITTVLSLGTLLLTGHEGKPRQARRHAFAPPWRTRVTPRVSKPRESPTPPSRCC